MLIMLDLAVQSRHRPPWAPHAQSRCWVSQHAPDDARHGCADSTVGRGATPPNAGGKFRLLELLIAWHVHSEQIPSRASETSLQAVVGLSKRPCFYAPILVVGHVTGR